MLLVVVCELELLERAVVQRTVGPLAVVLLTLGRQSTTRVAERPEPAGVQALVTQTSVEALNVTVSHRAARWMCTSATWESSAQASSVEM